MSDLTPPVEIFRALTAGSCDERVLVLEAAGVPALIERDGGAYVLRVPATRVAEAQAELERYAQENRPWVRPAPPRLHRGAPLTALVYAALMFAVGVAASRSWLGLDWFGAGVLDGVRLRGGQWWRALTALTLHGDLAHLAANVGFGMLFGGLAARLYGAGVGWLLIVVAAALANFGNGLWMPDGQSSLGASTAVFAALGMLGVRRWPAATRGGRLVMPGASLVAALTLLTLLGTGDEHTDILAHALGFGAGAVLALPLRRWPVAENLKLQRLAGTLALGAVGGAWAAALLADLAHRA